MWDVSDGVVRAVLGLVLVDHWYDAHHGEAVFRAGRLVRLKVGDWTSHTDPGGRPLTVGFTYFPDLAAGRALDATPRGPEGFVRAAGFTRVYAGGVLVEEIPLGLVHVTTGRLEGG